MPESSVQEAVLRLARQLKLIPTAPPGNPGPAYHPGPEWPVQSLSDAASVPAQFFGELLRGLMDPLGANNQAPVENIGALLGAAMPLAGGLRGLRAGQLAEEAATAGRAAKGAQGIKAYHGSPHDFDQFSLSKIGTGEGAQAYGHGLYFAENEAVAAQYRKPGMWQHIVDTTIDGTPAKQWAVGNRSAVEARAADALGRTANIDEAISYLGQDAEYNAMAAKAKQWLEQNRQRVSNTGRTYEVQINANPDHLLDWDAPLDAQTQHVRNALLRAGLDESDVHPPIGARAYATLDAAPKQFSIKPDMSNFDEAMAQIKEGRKGASARLKEAGIPGIKYLDGGSRASGEGSRNFVIFDDSLVSILKKYGVALPMIEALRRKATTNNGTVPATDVHGLIGG